METIQGCMHKCQYLRIAVVASRFNQTIVKCLVEGSLDTLLRHGVKEENITLAWVPGAFELPMIAKKIASSGQYHAVICLGTVIRGATPHFDYVAAQTASGICQAGIDTGIPVIFGVLTTETIEQAVERSGTKAGNKGCDAALAAIEMADLVRVLNEKAPSKSPLSES